MKTRILSVLLIGCLLLTATPVLGAGGNYYGVLSRYIVTYDGFQEVCMVQMILPDSSTADYTLAKQVYIDGVYMSDVNAIVACLESHSKSYTKFVVTNDLITALYFGGTTGSSYTNVAYSVAYGTFTGIPGGTGALPIYYKFGETYYAPYLDTNHIYNVTLYDYGIEITSMQARYIDGTIYTIQANPRLDKDLNMMIGVEGIATPGGVTLEGILYNTTGKKVCEVSCPVYGNKNVALDFTGIPNQPATYQMEVWLSGENGASLSPKYSLNVKTEVIPISTTTVLNKAIQSGWSNYVILQLELENGTTAVANVSNSVTINGVKYSGASEIYKNLLIGSEIRCAVNEDGEIYVVTFEKPVADTYGVVTQVINEGDGNASVSLILPDKNYGEYGYYLNQNFVKNLENLDTWCRNLEIGSCVKFGVDQEYGTTITAMDIDEDGAECYTDIRYQSSNGTFAGLSAETKDLPIYYENGEGYSAPVIEEKSILNDGALYDIMVYEYGIVITNREYGEINVLAFYPTMNIDFKQDLQVAYGIWDESAIGKTLHVQLLDDSNKVLEQTSKVIVDGNTDEDSGVWFRNYPNEDAAYHLKLWITNETGTQISPTYTESSFDYLAGRTNTTELEIKTGIVVSENTSTHPNTIKVQIKSYPNGIQTTKYVTFSIGTNVNGKTFATAQDLAGELPVGTLIEYVEGTGNYGSVIRFSKGKQQVVSSASYDQAEKKVTAKITLRSNDAKEGDTSSVVGIVYAGVYNKDGFLKGIATVPETALKADGTAAEVPFEVEGITLEQGDYLKAFFWKTDNNAAISNVATGKIQ